MTENLRASGKTLIPGLTKCSGDFFLEIPRDCGVGMRSFMETFVFVQSKSSRDPWFVYFDFSHLTMPSLSSAYHHRHTFNSRLIDIKEYSDFSSPIKNISENFGSNTKKVPRDKLEVGRRCIFRYVFKGSVGDAFYKSQKFSTRCIFPNPNLCHKALTAYGSPIFTTRFDHRPRLVPKLSFRLRSRPSSPPPALFQYEGTSFIGFPVH